MMEVFSVLVALIVFGLPVWSIVLVVIVRRRQSAKRRKAVAEIESQAESLARSVIQNFLVQPCPRCHEAMMQLIEVSPSGRSVQYKCVHCGKDMRSAAGAPGANETASLQNQFRSTLEGFNRSYPSSLIEIRIDFSTPEAPLLYERTSREPIPEAVRTEVWRRDCGRCVNCESCEQLEFDHIIPVSRGGATAARNLQLLCKQCNLRKASRI